MEYGGMYADVMSALGWGLFFLAIIVIIKISLNNKWLKVDLDRVKDDTVECEIELQQLKNKNYKLGAHLLSQPFMPDYLGFEFTRIRDKKTDAFQADVYTRDGFNIGRHIETEKTEWIILDPKGNKFETNMDNMYHAIVMLQYLGLDISVEDYIHGRI